MSSEHIQNTKRQAQTPLFFSVALAIGMGLGAWLFGGRSLVPRGVASQQGGKFTEVLSFLDRYYVDTVAVETMTEEAIENMLKHLDPHTVYIPAKDYELVNAPLEGEFVGIGIEYNIFHDTVNVMSTVPNGPAEKAGMLAGDKIVRVDSVTIAGQRHNERFIVDQLRGEEGSEATLWVARSSSSELLPLRVKRAKIETSSIDIAYLPEETVGYIRINKFGAKTYTEFKQALDSLLKAGAKGMILDLRSNGGGYLDRAVSIVDEFLPEGQLIVYTEGRQSRFDERSLATKGGKFEEGPLVVLIDEYSASASEIVAGALQDNDRAVIVGRRSFGKGLVQRSMMLSDGSSLRVTISRYYTPSGRSIQKPYTAEGYDDNVSKRYSHGELFTADSIAMDSVKQYFTLQKKRPVFGGGGIMPDIFIALDTSYHSSYYVSVANKNLLREFALQYAVANKERLLALGKEGFSKSYDVEKEAMPSFQQFASKAGVPFNAEDYAKCRRVMLVELKSLLARNIWKDEGFYPIYHQIEPEVQKAIEIASGRAEGM